MTLENGVGAEVTEQAAWYNEPLYAVVLVVPKGTSTDSWNKQAGNLVKIGQVTGSDLHLGKVKISVEEIKEAYEKSWQGAFPKLS